MSKLPVLPNPLVSRNKGSSIPEGEACKRRLTQVRLLLIFLGWVFWSSEKFLKFGVMGPYQLLKCCFWRPIFLKAISRTENANCLWHFHPCFESVLWSEPSLGKNVNLNLQSGVLYKSTFHGNCDRKCQLQFPHVWRRSLMVGAKTYQSFGREDWWTWCFFLLLLKFRIVENYLVQWSAENAISLWFHQACQACAFEGIFSETIIKTEQILDHSFTILSVHLSSVKMLLQQL